jgi:hypothetical protein
MRDQCVNCRPGSTTVPGSEFRVPSWPVTRNVELETRNRLPGAFLFAPSRSSALQGGWRPRCCQVHLDTDARVCADGIVGLQLLIRVIRAIRGSFCSPSQRPCFPKPAAPLEEGQRVHAARVAGVSGCALKQVKPSQAQSNLVAPSQTESRWIKPNQGGSSQRDGERGWSGRFQERRADSVVCVCRDYVRFRADMAVRAPVGAVSLSSPALPCRRPQEFFDWNWAGLAAQSAHCL